MNELFCALGYGELVFVFNLCISYFCAGKTKIKACGILSGVAESTFKDKSKRIKRLILSSTFLSERKQFMKKIIMLNCHNETTHNRSKCLAHCQSLLILTYNRFY